MKKLLVAAILLLAVLASYGQERPKWVFIDIEHFYRHKPVCSYKERRITPKYTRHRHDPSRFTYKEIQCIGQASYGRCRMRTSSYSGFCSLHNK